MNSRNSLPNTVKSLLTCFSALFLESLKLLILAGLLTYSVIERPSHSLRTVDWVVFNDFGGAYSSGAVQDFHLIPFSSLFRRTGFVTPKPEAKVNIIFKQFPIFYK